ncbi:DUF6458 family protein [Aquipuribacter sp. SD81]|uniref:DUF6458 family protein n=1 Tax=Aquipuribacter sp. SD81 TaxID=3127703 RepID=UPI00301B1A43
MSIGSGIVLILLGAVLAFAVEADQFGALNINVVGWILMAGGAVGLVIGLMLMTRRTGPRRTRRTEVVENNGNETVRRTDNVID